MSDESKEDNTSRSLLGSCFCRSGLGVSGTEGGGLGGAKGATAVECAALCETTAAKLVEALTLYIS